MAFSNVIINQAWIRSGGRCECERYMHDHYHRCKRQLIFKKCGKGGVGAWDTHHKNNIGGDGLSNCEILCSLCLAKARSFGV